MYLPFILHQMAAQSFRCGWVLQAGVCGETGAQDLTLNTAAPSNQVNKAPATCGSRHTM